MMNLRNVYNKLMCLDYKTMSKCAKLMKIGSGNLKIYKPSGCEPSHVVLILFWPILYSIVYMEPLSSHKPLNSA